MISKVSKIAVITVCLGVGSVVMVPTTPAYGIGFGIAAAIEQLMGFLSEMQDEMSQHFTDVQTDATEVLAYNQERQMRADLEIENGKAIQEVDRINEQTQREALTNFSVTLEACKRITARKFEQRMESEEKVRRNRRKMSVNDITTGKSEKYGTTEGAINSRRAKVVNEYQSREDALQGAMSNIQLFTGGVFEGVSKEELDKAIEDAAVVVSGEIPPLVDPKDEKTVTKRAEAIMRWGLATNTFMEIAGNNSSVDGTAPFQILYRDLDTAASEDELKALEELPSEKEVLEDIARSMRINNRVAGLLLKELQRQSLLDAATLSSVNHGAGEVAIMSRMRDQMEKQ